MEYREQQLAAALDDVMPGFTLADTGLPYPVVYTDAGDFIYLGELDRGEEYIVCPWNRYARCWDVNLMRLGNSLGCIISIPEGYAGDCPRVLWDAISSQLKAMAAD
jgi:hypothetical protein